MKDSRIEKSFNELDELLGKIPESQMWCGCDSKNKLYFKNQDRFIQHLKDEHKSILPEIIKDIKKSINEVVKQ